ncbi:hypothetical protein Cni_G20811 [Canna indica]|uniref:4-coumarate--CoA ligase n=1 Tax=Canna indica TaxID=4628 RepID=A0AAQ3KUN5_9LILI|nr:hypothetical protein Cni_G20811 [Canna indica]
MDTTRNMEDLFSKLHPCFPVQTSIAILGAGPSGLSVAYTLAKLGYSNVTIFEKGQTVSGMCESVDIEGKIYDLGGQVIAANSAPVISHLAKEVGAEFEEMDSHKLALIDSHSGNFEDMKVADDYVSLISMTLKLQDEARNSGHIGIHALSEIASDSTIDFLKLHGMSSLPKSVAYGYTASGYGFVQDMPYAYIQEFTRTSMAGKIRRFKGGYMSLWKKLSELLPFKVLCKTEVLNVKRDNLGVRITVKNANGEQEITEFDKVIISGALPFKNGRTYRSSTLTTEDNEVLDLNDLEKQLFCKVQAIDYYTTVLKIKGFEHMPVGFYYFWEFMEDPATIGHPVAMQRFFADTNIFLFWSYGNSSDIRASTVTKLLTNVVKSMGGVVDKVVMQRRFKYFPHVNTTDMKNGFFQKLESELQGFQNTYYVGGLMAFELTERNSSYAMALVLKYFANDSEIPSIPYVKRLFPLSPSDSPYFIRELGELPGVEFTDLPSLDGYLKFWGTHPIIGNKILYSWINEEGQVVNQRTYSELQANASHIAQQLLTSSKPTFRAGDRVLLIYLPGLEFIDAFFGCIKAKIIPVPVLPPDPLQRGGQALLKIQNISKSCRTVAILSTSSYHAAVRVGFMKYVIPLAKSNVNSSASWPDLPWVHTDSLVKKYKSQSVKSHSKDLESEAINFEFQPDDLCFLQFTSGSTGDPKGVMITHGGLIHNVKTMRKRYKSTSKTILVSWLPQYHDMGLIGGLFTALVSGGSAILFSPMTFIRNPVLWLQTMSDYQATHTAAPNFAIELVIRRLESDKVKNHAYDLSSMVFLMVAAEPVRQKTLKKFIQISQPFGLSQEVLAPGYGLAENCVFVSCAFGEGKPVLVDWQGRVCCGYIDPNDSDVDIRIVDPQTHKELKEYGKEGEIWISSPSAGLGYWGNHDLSKKTFFNQIENQVDKRYTRTGDLGRIIDGKLFITGRIKDLIIVSGRNIYSADVEKTVEGSSEFIRPGCCAVIGVPEEVLIEKGISFSETSDQVGLVVIAEIKEGKSINEEIVQQIKSRVVEEHGVAVASVKLIKPRTMSKTTSGKIQRFECLKQFTNDTLSLATRSVSSKNSLFRSLTTGSSLERNRLHHPLGSPRSLHSQSSNAGKDVREIINFLKGLVSEQTAIAVEKISATESLVSYGIDSIGVVKAAQKLSDYLGVPVGAVDIFTATCISDLASFSEKLLIKSQPKYMTMTSHLLKVRGDSLEPDINPSAIQKLLIWFIQILAIGYVSSILIFPAYATSSTFLTFVSILLNAERPCISSLISLVLAPLAWIFYIFLTCLFLSIFGNSFLQPNYSLTPEVSIWSIDFVKWWALSKAEEMASKFLGVYLRGTIFMNYWYKMQGARIGPSVLIDTVDITDPSLVSIGQGAVIAEGVLIQSHELRNGVLSFCSINIGRNSAIGPYAVIQKGSIVGEGAEIQPLQNVDAANPIDSSERTSKIEKKELYEGIPKKLVSLYHFFGIYAIGFLSSLSGVIIYLSYIYLFRGSFLLHDFMFVCLVGAFHWLPATVAIFASMDKEIPSNPTTYAFLIAIAYLSHGLVLCLLTGTLNYCLAEKERSPKSHMKAWFLHRINIACHVRFAKLLSGTEAFCMYLRLLGAKVGRHCSIRAINPVSNPRMISIGDGVHLGDFSRIVTGFYSSDGFVSGDIQVKKNSLVGSHSLILCSSQIEEDVVLGALSIAPMGCILQRGGIYIGSKTPTMVKNTFHVLDERIEEMDTKYKMIVGKLAGNLAITTMKVNSRYFHRIGVGGKGVLKMYQDLLGLPKHKFFSPSKCFPVLIRHSNSLSADDDARIDARGAALRILSEESNDVPLLDLTLKTGSAFYARTIEDFATWLVCGLPAREQQVKRSPHIRDAVWDSLRNTNSYTELHYYSNICRLLKFDNGEKMYVKFKLRPFNPEIDEDSGQVDPKGILPPETGAIPREDNDTRPLLFLADDFQRRVNSPDHVHYIFQLQLRQIPSDEAEREEALDCTRPWDETEYPYINIGEITIDQNLTSEESERLEFNPFIRCDEVDVIKATSFSQSASIDHGRSLVYEICQHLRNGTPIPMAWRSFLEQSDAKVDLSGCPMATADLTKEVRDQKVTLARTWYQTLWATLCQPLLQTFLPYFIIGLAIFMLLHWMLIINSAMNLPLYWLLPPFWVASGVTAALACAMVKWVLVGKKKEGEAVHIWSFVVFMDTVWQALRSTVGDYFMDMVTGSMLFGMWMRLMGASIEVEDGVYVDSMGAVVNPEMVEIEKGGAVGRDAVLFGHIYEGEEGRVKYGKVKIEEGGFIGSRAVVMPGVRVESGGCLAALSLAMKEEVVSRGNPTVEVDLVTSSGCLFRSVVPSGASTGIYEALEPRDGDKVYGDKGVLLAVKNINEILGPKLIDVEPRNQANVDAIMLEIDGTMSLGVWR